MGKKNVKWSEEKIQNILRLNFLSNNTKKYEMFNKFLYDWESDYIAITKSGYVYECEIKISRGDFFNDQKKTQKHLILESKDTFESRPNYLYYAVPEGLILPEEIPNGYGLLYVQEWGYVNIVKPAKKLHNEKINMEKLKLMDKFYYTMWDYIDRYRKMDVKQYTDRIKQLEKDNIELDNLLSEANGRIDEMKLERKKEEEDLKVLKEFCSKMKQEDMDPKIAEIVNDHFFEML